MKRGVIKTKLFTFPIFIIMIVLIVYLSAQSTMFYGYMVDSQDEVKRLKKSVISMNKIIDTHQKYKSSNTEFKLFAFTVVSQKYNKLLDSVYRISKKHEIDPYIILSMVRNESNFDPNATSYYRDGRLCSVGLLQINYNVWKSTYKLDLSRMYEVDYNLDIGVQILKHYLKMSDGNIQKALFYYNNGTSGTYSNTKYAPKIIKTMLSVERKLSEI